MKARQLSTLLLVTFAAISGIAALLDAPGVPFHPDESTYLFMSGDFEKFFQNPLALAWQPQTQADPRSIYRTLDGPLVRYWIGLSRWMAGQPPLTTDWDWSKTWQQNILSEAMPTPSQLNAGRLGMTLLLPFSVILLFLAARQVWNDRVAWISAVLLAGNALVLLHGRRAMAEGLVVFTSSLLMWSLVVTQKKGWLNAIPAVLAFCAKYSLAALAPVAFIGVVWQPGKNKAAILRQAVLFAFLFLAVAFLLNPFLWSHPLQALQAALTNRTELTQKQVQDRPSGGMDSLGMKVLGMMGGVYLTPPLFAETSNYADQTRGVEEAYLANPLHNLLRSVSGGSLLFLISLIGFTSAGIKSIKQWKNSRSPLLLLLATLLQALALLFLLPLPFQRYYIPLVPFTCLWAGVGADWLVNMFWMKYESSRQYSLKPNRR